jgi:hypothetical protein
MITRRDFIKGLGAAAAAVVMPRVKPSRIEEFAEAAYANYTPELLDNLGVDWGAGDDRTAWLVLRGDGTSYYATDEMLTRSTAGMGIADNLGMVIDLGECVSFDEWRASHSDRSLEEARAKDELFDCEWDKWIAPYYATDEILADCLYTADELLEMASQPSDGTRVFYVDEDWSYDDDSPIIDAPSGVSCTGWTLRMVWSRLCVGLYTG